MSRREVMAGLSLCGLPAEGGELPPLPEAIAGQFVGVHGGRLIVAGGTIWTKPKWEGGEKRWTAAIYTLGPDDKEWRRSGEQDEELAYGGAISTPQGLICVAGQSVSGASTAVGLLSWDGSRIQSRPLADLPEPRMALAGAGCGDAVVALAGQSSPGATTASKKVWQMEPAGGSWQKARWREAPPIPGPGRILPAAAGWRNAVYVASGAALSETASGTAVRTYLRDAYVYRPGSEWEALPELPAAAVAAPAICDEMGSFVVFGGDDGTLAGRTPDLGPRHPGFRRTILRLVDRSWLEAGRLPESLVTTGAVWWKGAAVISGGENRPGARTGRVLSVRGRE